MGSSRDEEIRQLAEKLDREFDEYLAGLERKPYTEGWSQDNWEAEMQEHPAFRTKPFEPGEELPPLFEAMQQLKYDPEHNSVLDLCTSHKEDGNFQFKHKKYRHAVLSYSEGLKLCQDTELTDQLKALKTILLTNRAAANYHLENYRSCLQDCVRALRVKPSHWKALKRAIEVSIQLKDWDIADKICSQGFRVRSAADGEDINQLNSWAKIIEQGKKGRERDQRKEELKMRKQEEQEKKLSNAIQARGIRFLEIGPKNPLHPAAESHEVHLDLLEDGSQILVWPLLFLYPETSQTDFVEAFQETDSFQGHLELMFAEPPHWNIETDGAYSKSEYLRVFFAASDDVDQIVEVPQSVKLLDALRHSKYVVRQGVPGFMVLSAKSKYFKEFLSRHNVCSTVKSR